jgi:hypothetical protein
VEIPIEVTTNVDFYRGKTWPNRVCCKPEKGDYLMSSDGTHARIIRVVHCTRMVDNHNLQQAYLLIELTKPVV